MSKYEAAAKDALVELNALDQAITVMHARLRYLPEQLAQARIPLDEAANALDAGLDALAHNVSALGQRLTHAAEALQDAAAKGQESLSSALEAWSAAETTAAAELEAARETLDALPVAIEDETRVFERESAEFTTALGHIATAQMPDAVQSAEQDLQGVTAALDQAREALQRATRDLTERAQAARLSLAQEVDRRVLPSIDASSAALAARVRAVLEEEVRNQATLALQELEGAVLHGTATLLSSLLDKMRAAIAASADEFVNQGAASTRQRTRLEPVRRELEAIAGPVEDALNHIRDIMRQVGFA